MSGTEVFVRRTTVLLLLFAGIVSVIAVIFISLYSTSPSREQLGPNYVVRPTPEKVIDEKTKTTTDQKTTTTTTGTTSEKPALEWPWEKNYRIPEDHLPVHYDLYLHPDLEAGTFSGRVGIQIDVRSKTTYLLAHTNYLNITKTNLKDMSSMNYIEVKKQFEYKPNQFWVVLPRSSLDPGNYTLYLEFEGSLRDKIVGFYESTYKNKNGENRKMATSKFQPTSAREAFPCFDEPSFKSTFSISLVKPSRGYRALSNMPQQSEKMDSPRTGLTEVQFEKSVPMVTYLACFIVCDFEYLETKTKDGKPFRVYATPEQTNRSQYALDIGVSILNYYEEYFEVKYPLPKQDMIAIPDFVSGAMEHWGLITYRETAMLYDEQGSSSYNKQRVASVVSHELAHMWFGNLVTLKWWNDLWLNEGFASYIEYKGVAQYEKDWNMMDQFVVNDLQVALNLDSQLSSHPIIQTVGHPDQITEIFDAISYAKGASVLRMLDNFMGEENFRIGVRNFLREFAFSNAVTADLWRHLAEASPDKLDISAIMDTWTRQMGYPVLDVKRIDRNTVEVRQTRFLADPNAIGTDDSPYGYKWDIPITYLVSGSEAKLVWLNRDMEKLTLKIDAGSWFKLNMGRFGYYRVNYDEKTWRQLIDALNQDPYVFEVADRANLLDDAFSLAAASLLSYSTAFNLSMYLNREREYVPWKTTSVHLGKLNHMLMETKAYPLYRTYMLQLVQSHASRVGWEDGGQHQQRLLRPLLLSLACKADEGAHTKIARQKLQHWLAKGNQVLPPNLRSVVYKYGVQGYDEWKQLLDRYVQENNAQERNNLMVGLTSASQPWVIHRFIQEIQNKTVVRTQDYLSGLRRLGSNPVARPIVWNFIKSHWEWLVDRYTINSRYLGSTVKLIVGSFTTKLQLADAEAFFAKYPNAGAGSRARRQAIEKLNRNIAWLENNLNSTYDWLSVNAYRNV